MKGAGIPPKNRPPAVAKITPKGFFERVPPERFTPCKYGP
jgi:hypothetical protein